jgi:hypothetical protein
MTASDNELIGKPAASPGRTRVLVIDDDRKLCRLIRDRNYDVFDRSEDVHISALRRKLGGDPKTPRFIRTVRSAGYICIEPDNA